MTTGAYYLKRGDTFDPEDFRMTHRLGVAHSLLKSQGVEVEWDHGPGTGVVGTGLLAREGHVCDYRCKAVWPEWMTDEVFEAAFRLADELQDKRGSWHRSQAYAAKAASR